MGLIQAAFLAGMAALAIPVIVHLIFHWQTRRVELGSVRFLADIIRENARRKRLKRWLLLLLRCAGVALLVLAFARPYLHARQESGPGRFIAILIDRSASMALNTDGDRLLDRAVERARDIVGAAAEKTDVEVAFFDDSVQPLRSTDTADRDRSAYDDLREVRLPDRLDAGTSFGTAMSWARDLCLQSPHHERDVYVISDLQRAGLDWTLPAPFPEGVEVHIEDLGRDQVNSVAILNAAPARSLVRPGDEVTCRVTLFNFGPFELPDVPVLLTLSSGSRTHRLRESVLLPPNEAVEVEFAVPALDPGFWNGSVHIEAADDLTFDNDRHFAVLARPRYEVLIVDGGDGLDRTGSETFLLEAALRLAPPGKTYAHSPFSTRTVYYRSDGTLPALDNLDLVVLADAPLSAFDAARLAAFVEAGGGLLVFGGDRMTPEDATPLADAGLLPGPVTQIARTSDLPFRWQHWDVEHPLFEPFADPQSGDLRRLSFNSFAEVDPAASVRPLAEFSDGRPALTEHTLGSGRVIWFAAGCGRSDGDWTRSRLFLPVVHQMLADLARLTGGGPVRYTSLEQEPLNSPGDTGSEHTPSSGRSQSQIRQPGIVEHDGYWEVINVNPRESDPDRCTPAEFAQRFQFELQEDAVEGIVATSAASLGPRGFETRTDEVWYWFVCAALAVFVLEWLLSNRTPA